MKKQGENVFHVLFLSCFRHFPNQKKKYQRNRSALKHALVNSNKESIMKSRIIRLSQFKVGFNITNSWNHKSYITENKVISSLLHALLHGSKTIAPPTPKLTQTLTLTRVQFICGAIVWLPPTLKLTLTLTENPALTGGQFSLWGNCPDALLHIIFSHQEKKKYLKYAFSK